MRIRRYVARSIQEALERVREELGPEALILHTRRRWRWWVPWQPANVEVVVAWEPPRAGRTSSGASPQVSGRRGGPLARALREMVPDGRADGGYPAPVDHPIPASPATMPPPAAASTESVWFQRLVEQDVDPSLAWRLVAGASARSRGAKIPFHRALADQLAVTVPTQPVWEQDRRLRTVVLVGPTGAGKTTTVAKLAANFALVGRWRVGLVAADTYRIGAIQQLRTYAELIGVPLDVAQDGSELRQILAASDRQLVLVDTAGHAPKDTGRLAGIRELCAALPEGSEVLLVVPALLRQEDLAELLRAYRELPVTAVCVTKLDETSRRGALVNAPCWMGRPLRFVTTGQAVPDDIETADPQTLARWLLYGGDGGPDLPPVDAGPPAGGRSDR